MDRVPHYIVTQKINLKRLSRMKQEGQRENKCEKLVKRHAERMKKSYICLFRVPRDSWRNGEEKRY